MPREAETNFISIYTLSSLHLPVPVPGIHPPAASSSPFPSQGSSRAFPGQLSPPHPTRGSTQLPTTGNPGRVSAAQEEGHCPATAEAPTPADT